MHGLGAWSENILKAMTHLTDTSMEWTITQSLMVTESDGDDEWMEIDELTGMLLPPDTTSACI